MTTDRETLRIIGSWMEDGRTRLPDHVLDAVLDQLPSTPQRRPGWSARRISPMNALAKYAVATAAVVVVAIAGLNLLGGSSVVGRPSPSPTASPRTLHEGALEPGTYVAHPLPAPHTGLELTFTVPAGWSGWESGLVPVGAPTTGAPGGIAIQFLDVAGLNIDPCRWEAPRELSVGPGVDDLVLALRAQTAYEVSEPVDVTIGGFRGKRVDIVSPTAPFAGQTATAPGCDSERYHLWSTTSTGEDGVYVQGPGNRWQANILDVDGTRLVVVVQDFPGTSAADRAQLDAIVGSFVIEP